MVPIFGDSKSNTMVTKCFTERKYTKLPIFPHMMQSLLSLGTLYMRVCARVHTTRKFRPITCHEGTEEKQRYSSTLSLTSVLDRGGWLIPCPSHFNPVNDQSGTHSTGSWVGNRAGPGGCGKFRPHQDPIPGQSSLLYRTDLYLH
jgi:hypothetical protein